MSNFLAKLNQAAGDSLLIQSEPMKNHTTFRIGGPAGYFVSPSGETELGRIIRLCREEGMPYFILGNGSNLLVSDQGYQGVMIRMGDGFSFLQKEKQEYTIGSGMLLSRIAREALEDSLTGFEFAAGIPGSLGGAVVMNAGAYGREMKDVIQKARVMTAEGEILELSAAELELGYRSSCILRNRYIVLSATLHLEEGTRQQIREQMEDLAARRREKQPLEYPSAGSTFKRPAGYFAGKLIEDAGLRGFQVGGAQVSEKHCGFVINREQATAEDVRSLCRQVSRRVKETAGVDLETEVRMIGWESD